MFLRWLSVRVALVGAVVAMQKAVMPHAAAAQGKTAQAAIGSLHAWGGYFGPTTLALALIGVSVIGYARRADMRQIARITV